MISDYARNFFIYYNNLSTYYVICVLMSIIAIIVSWLFHFKNIKEETDPLGETTETNKGNANNADSNSEFENILSAFKKTRKQTIEKMAATLTDDQLQEEKQAEKEQLAAILELLKQQEDKFQVGSMEELEGQLKLYR